MATTRKREIPEAEAERQVTDAFERLDELRVTQLKLVSDEQGWKSAVLRSELERLEPVLTHDHPRLVRMRAEIDHYTQSREAIDILLKETEDTNGPMTMDPWELTGLVRYEKIESPLGLKVVLAPEDKNLETLEAECNADGFYRLSLDGESVAQYLDTPMSLSVFYKTRKPIYTAEKPLFIKPGKQREDISI